MLRILTVCTGNVCRSPLAALLLAERLDGLPVVVESAGMRALVDQPTTAETERIAIEHGLAADRVAAHRARLADETVLGEADLILAMAREHRHAIVDLVPTRLRSTFTLRELARLGREATDAELEEAAAAAADPKERLRRVLGFVATLRGTIGPPQAAVDDDVIDPYRRSWDTYLLSASQLVPAVDDVARVLRVAASGSASDSLSAGAAATDGPPGDGAGGPSGRRMGIWAPTERHSWN